MFRDFRFAVRALRRTPGFTLTAIASLAVGFALTASTTAVMNAYLIRSLPYAAADRLFHVMYAPPGPWEPRGMSALDWKSLDDVVEFPITASGETFYLTDGPYSQSATGLRVGRGFVEGLGVRSIAGRSLTGADFQDGSEKVGLIGYSMWRDGYGSDPAIIGGYLRAEAENQNGRTEVVRIVGVLPAGFYFGRDSGQKVDLLVPLASAVRTYMVRLQQGVSPARAERRITEAAKQVAIDLPPDWSGAHLEGAHERYVAELRPVLVGVMAASVLVLIIVGGNVAVLVVLRTMRREKEMAVRAALGSGRARLLRMLAAEASLLCAVSLALAVALTRAVLVVLAPLIEAQLGRPAPGGTSAIAVDATVLLLVGGAGVLIALSLSFVPVLTAWRRGLAEALRRESAAVSGSRAARRLRSALIALEVAGTLVLLVGCALMIRSVTVMVRTDLGFEPAGLLRARVVLRGSDYPDPAAFLRFYDAFAERLSVVAGSPVAFAYWPPFVEFPRLSVEATDGGAGTALSAGGTVVGARYFTTLGLQLRAGREFTRADAPGSEPVAVISQALADRLWPRQDPAGRHVRVIEQTPARSRPGVWRTVVGVVADVRQTYSDTDPSDVYIPFAQASPGRFNSFYIRSDRSPSSLLASAREVAAEIDSHAIVNAPRPVAGENRRLAGTRFLTSLLIAFAVVAAFVASVGIYGVTAYAVQQREREIAIRMSLGAPAGALVWMFLKDSGAVFGAGVGIGLVGAVGVGRVLRSQLYGVQTFDLPTIAAASSLLLATALVATWWPARRAAARSPVAGLREI